MNDQLLQSPSGDWIEPTKFDRLRIKTENQLVHLINAELDLGIQAARQALKSADTWTVAEVCRQRANNRYDTASRLISLVAEITEDLESKLDHLKRMLQTLSTIGSTPRPAEEKIAALARAVWEARGSPEGPPEDDWFRAERALKAERNRTLPACVGKN